MAGASVWASAAADVAFKVLSELQEPVVEIGRYERGIALDAQPLRILPDTGSKMGVHWFDVIRNYDGVVTDQDLIRCATHDSNASDDASGPVPTLLQRIQGLPNHRLQISVDELEYDQRQ